VDGKYIGNAPSMVHLPVGDHTIKFEMNGYKAWERTVSITLGESTTVAATLLKLDTAPKQ